MYLGIMVDNYGAMKIPLLDYVLLGVIEQNRAASMKQHVFSVGGLFFAIKIMGNQNKIDT